MYAGGSGNSAAVAAVKAHNDERAKYYSGHKVSWSTALASKAEKINRERGCDFKHDGRGSGENLSWHSRNIDPRAIKNVADAFVKAVKSWASEKSLMDKQGYKLRKSYYSCNGCSSSEVWSHYTQIVWKKTTKVCKYFYTIFHTMYIYSLSGSVLRGY